LGKIVTIAASERRGTKKKPLEKFSPADLGVDPAPRLKVLKVTEPPARQGGVKVSSVEELVEKLKNEAKVI